MTVSGAYGRDYASIEAMRTDWEAGKDFKIRSVDTKDIGRYCSKRDFVGIEVWGRFDRDGEQDILQRGRQYEE